MEKPFMSDALILKRASASYPCGQRSDDDYDVLSDGRVVGRIFLADDGPIFSVFEILAATSSTTIDAQSSMALMVEKALMLQTLDSAPRTSPEGPFPGDETEPTGVKWMWSLAYDCDEHHSPTHGRAETREDAMAAFEKSWRQHGRRIVDE